MRPRLKQKQPPKVSSFPREVWKYKRVSSHQRRGTPSGAPAFQEQSKSCGQAQYHQERINSAPLSGSYCKVAWQRWYELYREVVKNYEQ